MKKILIETNLKSGGIEKFITNLMKYISPSDCELHFAVPYAEDHVEFYEQYVKEWGATIHKLGGHFEDEAYKGKAIILKRIRFYKLLKKERFDTCYINVGGAGAIHVIETYMALKLRVPNILVHCHTADVTEAKIQRYSNHKRNLHSILRWHWPQKNVKYLACSKLAAEWLFPKIAKKGNYEFIPNGIEVEEFRYDEQVRVWMRKKYGIKDELVILNIGRLSYAKNQIFLVEVFKEVLKIKQDSKLIIVGEGELEKKIRLLIKQYKLQEKVIMVGAVSKVMPYYSMADVFLFPSLYEGLGMVLLEAQVNGLPVVASNTVPEEVKQTENMKFIGLEENAGIWAKQVIDIAKSNRNESLSNRILKFVFDIKKVSLHMRNLLELN